MSNKRQHVTDRRFIKTAVLIWYATLGPLALHCNIMHTMSIHSYKSYLGKILTLLCWRKNPCCYLLSENILLQQHPILQYSTVRWRKTSYAHAWWCGQFPNARLVAAAGPPPMCEFLHERDDQPNLIVKWFLWRFFVLYLMPHRKKKPLHLVLYMTAAAGDMIYCHFFQSAHKLTGARDSCIYVVLIFNKKSRCATQIAPITINTSWKSDNTWAFHTQQQRLTCFTKYFYIGFVALKRETDFW